MVAGAYEGTTDSQGPSGYLGHSQSTLAASQCTFQAELFLVRTHTTLNHLRGAVFSALFSLARGLPRKYLHSVRLLLGIPTMAYERKEGSTCPGNQVPDTDWTRRRRAQHVSRRCGACLAASEALPPEHSPADRVHHLPLQPGVHVLQHDSVAPAPAAR